MGDELAGLAGFGPFFAVAGHRAGAAVAAPWRPLRELVDGGDVLGERISEVQARLDTEPRVAASVAHLGLVARLLSPAFGHALRYGRLLALDPDGTWWQPTFGGSFPLSVPVDPGAGRAAAADVAGLLAGWLVDGPVGALTRATASRSVSTRLLWGNVASALHGATTAIRLTSPQWMGPARRLAAAVLELPPLRGTAGGEPGGEFRRRSCCLIYRAGTGLCGDCVLRP